MDRFTEQPTERECSTKGCENTVKSRDQLLTKCQECREKELERERRLDRDMNRELSDEASGYVKQGHKAEMEAGY